MARIINTAEMDRTKLDQFTSDQIYNGLDVCLTLEVLHAMEPMLDPVSRPIYEFSKALQAPVLDMTMRGVRVDQGRRTVAHKLIVDTIARISAQLDRLVKEGIGTDVSWRSPKQLQDLFYGVMQLAPVKRRNANGQFVPTVDRDAIEKLCQYLPAEPICLHLILLRELDKKRQFLEGLTGPRFFYNFNIAGTVTGRLSSEFSVFDEGGNAQNIDRELRSIFIADEGFKFLNLDLEQGDSRNVGAVCWNHFVESVGVKIAGAYLDACESGDLHTTVSRMVWPELGWTDDRAENRRHADILFYRQDSYRQSSKKLGHGTNFFGTDKHMASQTRIPKNLVEEFQRKYFTAFPVIGAYDKRDHKVDHWHNRVRLAIRQFGHLTTLLGRRRFFFGNPADEETLRAAIAYEPQSLTADEVDQGMLRIWRAQRVQLLLQVHDSILCQYPAEQEDEILPWALTAMSVTINLKKDRPFTVPVEAKVGWNWGEADEKNNPNGLIKWKGNDNRQRQAHSEGLSIHRLLGD